MLKRLARHLPRVITGKRSVPTYRVYKRQLVPVKQRSEMLHVLGQRLAQRNFFASLPDLHYARIKRFVFKGVPVTIKNTGAISSSESHGKNFEVFRASFLAHQTAVRKGKIRPKTYILRSPRVYGLIGNFLVMEYVEQHNFSLLEKETLRLDRAFKSELKANFLKLRKKGLIKKAPQTDDFIPVGNTNPKDPEKGKWVVFSVYDYL